MQCQTKTEQAREVRERAEDKAQAEEEEEWAEPGAPPADQVHVPQDTVFVLNAASKFLIRSDSPAAGKAARNAEQK